MNRSTEIRCITADELPVVRDLAARIWPHAYAGVIAPDQIEIMLRDIYALEALEDELTAQGHIFWIARHDGEDAAFASAFRRDGTVWIKKLYVLPEKQGHGLGRALIEAAVAHFTPSRALSLYVNNGNRRAIAFYERYGFSIEKSVPVRMGPFDFTDHVMTKTL